MSAIAPTRVQATRAYRRKLGDYEITALSDGFVDLSFGVWQGIEQEAFDAAWEAVDSVSLDTQGEIRDAVNAALRQWLEE